MRFFVGAIALLAGTAVAQDNCNCDCVLDECLAALAGPSPFIHESVSSDCRSFVWTVSTVSSERTVVTETFTATSTNTVVETAWTTITVGTTSAPLMKRQGGVATIPAYASACAQSSDYASACRCVGIAEGGTSYFHLPGVETITVTVTESTTQDLSVTTTATESAVATDLYFKIRVADVAENDDAQAWKGFYMYTVDEGTSTPPYKRLAFVNNANQGLIFRASPDGKVTGGDGTPFAADKVDAKAEQIYLQEPVAQQVLVEHNFDSGGKVVSGRFDGNGGSYSLLAITNNGRLWLYTTKAAIDGDKPSFGTVGPVILEAVPI
ncbi:hypothetical protein TWF173_005502 [Orbilia oligospora]|nr:hypothetical protein TWF173_005502 [Orbilia oligospora]